MKKTKDDLNELTNFALDNLIIKIFDFKNTLISFSTSKHVYTKNVDFDGNNDILSYKIYNKKLIDGMVDENFQIKNFTPYTLYEKLYNDDTILVQNDKFDLQIKDFKSLLLKIFKSFGFKNNNILSLYILHNIFPEELHSKKLSSNKFKVLSKEELKILEDKSFDKLCSKKFIDKKNLEEKIEKFILTKELSKNNKWLNKHLSFPGIYFVEHLLQLIVKIINK